MIFINFPKNQDSLNNPISKRIIENVNQYNILYSNLPRSVKYLLGFFYKLILKLRQKFLDAPFLLRRFFEFIITREGWLFFIKNLLGCFYVLSLLIYIISPLDLIPDTIPIIGWIDDLIILCYILIYLSVLYFDFLREN